MTTGPAARVEWKGEVKDSTNGVSGADHVKVEVVPDDGYSLFANFVCFLYHRKHSLNT